MRSTDSGGTGVADSPEPGVSGAITMKSRDRSSILRTQCIQLPVPPCSSTSGGPSPHTRQTTSPEPFEVVCRVAARSRAATNSAGVRAARFMAVSRGSPAKNRRDRR